MRPRFSGHAVDASSGPSPPRERMACEAPPPSPREPPARPKLARPRSVSVKSRLTQLAAASRRLKEGSGRPGVTRSADFLRASGGGRWGGPGLGGHAATRQRPRCRKHRGAAGRSLMRAERLCELYQERPGASGARGRG
ncbi:hypothetical protein [uncultured Meiothermus sp.]|uniref:hypothetical protein n=1 Tax=uncultured Meiothermus sp. TaxID=157471 RepID=UPI002634EE20|nr:hypothetical protein [uncultured Meiothermus sp.]